MNRTNKSIKNAKYAIIGQMLGLLISFVSRKIFVIILTKEYLGINGLFTNILSILAVSEMGIGTAIIYSMYKPIAENNVEKIKSLMKMYKKAYTSIGIFILLAGLSLTPFILYFISDVPNISENIYIIYILYVLNSSFSYFFIYKRSFIIANQNRYIATYYRYLFYFILNIVQIIILLLTESFYLYLVTQLLFTIIENIFVSKKADKLYPFLKDKKIKQISKKEKKDIYTNIKALFLHKVGGAIVNGTDNILISKMVNVISVGIYSNYYMIYYAINTVYSLLFQSVTASFGNLNVTASNEKKLSIFYELNFFGALFACITTSALIIMINHFITIWIGETFLFPMIVVVIICVNYYLRTLRQPILLAKETMGLFWYDRYRPIFEAIINLVFSIILCMTLRKYGDYFGVLGVFLGTLISTITTNLWIEPYVLFKYGFKSSLLTYFMKDIYYSILTFISVIIIYIICCKLQYNIVCFFLKGIISIVISSVVFIIGNIRSKDFRNLLERSKKLIKF